MEYKRKWVVLKRRGLDKREKVIAFFLSLSGAEPSFLHERLQHAQANNFPPYNCN